MKPVRIAVLGAAGRMGAAVIQAAARNPAVVLGAAIERPGMPALGRDAAQLAGLDPADVLIRASLAEVADMFDVAIDFTRPEPSLAAIEFCRGHGKGIVIGTTGFSDAEEQTIAAAARQIAVCKAANFSIGVNLCLELLEQAARALAGDFDIEVVEAHHRHKVDAPSGTALMMGEAVARGAGRSLKECAIYERYGHTGARGRDTIGFSTIRGGDVVGDHTVMFLGEGERVEITHKASSRLNFANGAVRAAAWLGGRPTGLYSMRDVLSG
jgi:4-hydroxy-tetrahydrodipicolinate reductase